MRLALTSIELLPQIRTLVSRFPHSCYRFRLFVNHGQFTTPFWPSSLLTLGYSIPRLLNIPETRTRIYALSFVTE